MTSELDKKIDSVKEDLLHCKSEVGRELEKGSIKINSLSKQVLTVANQIEDLSSRIDVLIEIFEAGEKFFKVIGWMGKFIKWVAMVGGSITVIYYFIKTGSWHK